MASIGNPGLVRGSSLSRCGVEFPAAAGEVMLWCADLDRAPEELSLDEAWLSDTERARADRFGSSLLRTTYVTGRALLRWLLATELAIPPETVPIREGRRGRPRLEGLHAIDFNVSHTGRFAVIGLLRSRIEGVHIGVDVERLDRIADVDRLARRVLSDDERASLLGLTANERQARFLRYWTCKEAMSKATADGLIAPFARITIDFDPVPRLTSGPSPYVPEAWQLRSLEASSGHLIAVALWQRETDDTEREE